VQSFHRPLLMSLLQAKVLAPLMGPRACGNTWNSSPPLPNRDAMNRPPRPLEQLVESDGHIGDSFVGGVEHRVHDGGRHADDDDLAEAFHADRVDDRVVAVDEQGVQLGDVALTGTR